MKTLKVGSVKIKVNAKGKARKFEVLKKGTWKFIDGQYQRLDKDTNREIDVYCMPFQSKNKIFKGSGGKNVFNPETLEAYSYNHWCYVKKINGKLVFNAYRYSVTTTKHQYEMRTLLRELGLKIYLEVNTYDSLSLFETSALKPMYRTMFELEVALKRKNSKPETNKERRKTIVKLKSDIAKARSLGAVLTKGKIKELRLNAFKEEVERLASLKKQSAERAEILKARREIVSKGEAFNLSA